MRMVALALSIVALAACGKVKGDDTTGPDADPCTTNTCECTAATEDTDCGVHEYCEVGGPGRTCECVAGYTKGATGCVFTGTIQDAAFMQASVWTPVNGALLNSTAVGGVDPGEASFLPSALCGLAAVKQTVDMPSFRKAEPLVLDLSYKNQVNFQQGFDQVLFGVSFGGTGWSPFQAFNDANFHSLRVCLPEGGYAPAATTGKGAPVTFELGPFVKPAACPNSTITNFAIDHAAIVTANAGECGAMPGIGANADAEGVGGWTFTTTNNSSGGFTAGLGVNNSKAARVTLNQRCDGAAMDTFFNVPSVDNPALEFFVGSSNNGTNGFIAFGNGQLVNLETPPSGVSVTAHQCLPPSLRGQTMNMSFRVNGGSGLCSDVLNFQVFADEVKVVDDPSCGTTANITNPGFEQGNLPFGAAGERNTATANAVIVTNAALAHTGQRALALQSQGRCANASYTMMPLVPPANGSAGPALTFFAGTGAAANANADATVTALGGGGAPISIAEGVGYQKYVVCLSPLFIGRMQTVVIRHFGGTGLCDNSNYPQQTTFVDDIDVTTDPSCPAQ